MKGRKSAFWTFYTALHKIMKTMHMTKQIFGIIQLMRNCKMILIGIFKLNLQTSIQAIE